MNQNKKAEGSAIRQFDTIALIIFIVVLEIGHALMSSAGILIILIAAIIFGIMVSGVDYPVYKGAWILFTVVMTIATVCNGVEGGWIVGGILMMIWRTIDGKKYGE